MKIHYRAAALEVGILPETAASEPHLHDTAPNPGRP